MYGRPNAGCLRRRISEERRGKGFRVFGVWTSCGSSIQHNEDTISGIGNVLDGGDHRALLQQAAAFARRPSEITKLIKRVHNLIGNSRR